VVDATAGSGGAAGAVAGAACFAHEAGVAATNRASDQAHTNRVEMGTGRFWPRSRIVTESPTCRSCPGRVSRIDDIAVSETDPNIIDVGYALRVPTVLRVLVLKGLGVLTVLLHRQHL
jgi:hypothetical protein